MDDLLEELLDVAMPYEEILEGLVDYTSNFTMESGEVGYDSDYESKVAETILNNHYMSVDNIGLGMITNEKKSAYIIQFSGPLGEDELEFPEEAVYESLLKESISINESNTSRIYTHLSSEKPCGIVSAYRGELSEKENKKRHSMLKKDLHILGYGYIEFISRWVEDGESFDEESFLIPNITQKDLLRLGDRYAQSSVIYKDEFGCVEICTRPFEGHDYGDVVRTFDNVGPGMLNIGEAEEIFARRKGGPASMPKKGGKPFTLKVVEKLEPRPAVFRGPGEHVVYERQKNFGGRSDE